MITDEVKYREVNYKFCQDFQERFLKFIEELDDANCTDAPANEAVYSLGCNVGSCVFSIIDPLEGEDKLKVSKDVLDVVFENAEQVTKRLFNPQAYPADERVLMLGDGVECND